MHHRMRQRVGFPVSVLCLLALVVPGCVQHRHFSLIDPPVSDAGAPPADPLPLRYRLTDFEVDLSSRAAGGMSLALGAFGGRTVRWRNDAPEDVRRSYKALVRSQAWMGTETPSDADADLRVAGRVTVQEQNTVWIPGILLYTLAATAGMAGGTGIGVAVSDGGFQVGGLMAGALGGLAVGLIAGSFIPTYRATVDVTGRTRLESTARKGGPGGTFYEKSHDTRRTELYSGWSSGENGRSAFVGEAVQINQRQMLDHLRETGPGMLRSLVNPDTSALKPSVLQGDSVPKDLPDEPTRVFVADVSIDVPGLTELGPVLASEIQVALQSSGRYQGLTLENLEAQLRKEKRKALLSCADDGCVQRIIENFGIPDTVFGRVKPLGTERVHLTLTWVRAGDVVHAVTAVSGRDPDALLPAMRDLATGLAAAVDRGEGE